MKQQFSFSLLSALIAGVVAQPAVADVVISQYVEGSSFNKAIEIANTGDEAVTLDHFKLALSRNGSGQWDSELSLAGKVIAAKDVLVIANSQANSDILAVSDMTDDTMTSFNGNDPVALLKDDEVYDVVGSMGGSDFAKDVTLVRHTDVLSASAEYQVTQWDTLEKNNIEGLGSLSDSSSSASFTCTMDDGSSPEFTSIHDIQGDGDKSPLIGDSSYITDDDYYVQGVVTAVTTGLNKGFYLQSLENDYNPQTSEGLFVYTNQSSSDLKAGDVVCVKGKVQEYYSQTQLKAGQNQWVKQDEQAVPRARSIFMLPTDENFDQTLERYEGMLVKLTPLTNMRVSRTFSWDYDAYRSNMVLSQGHINMHPNQQHVAGSDASEQQRIDNGQRRLFVESDQKAPNGVIPYYADFGRTDIDQNGSTEDYIRVGDMLVGAQGVLNYSYGEYRLTMTNQLSRHNFIHLDPRTETPLMHYGNLRIASFNVLNYFNSPFGGDANEHGESRGAGSYGEFEIQQEKIVNAIIRLDADIVGLMEIENNGFGESGAIHQLVDQLNARLSDSSDYYSVVEFDTNNDGQITKDDSVGTDVITTGVIYRKSKATLDSQQIIPMPKQLAPEVYSEAQGKVIEDGKNYQRQTLAPTFKIDGLDETLTVAVNHFKSKGSTCWEDAAPVSEGGQNMTDPDYQGSCENFRVAAAVALGEALEKVDGYKIILGDLNSYAKEDPMLILTDYDTAKYDKTIRAARNTYLGDQEQFGDQGAVIEKSYGYLNAVEMMRRHGWSYSYNDEVGTMDHLLISPELSSYVVDAMDWHINGGESKLFDYTSKNKGDLPRYSDQFRSSDHDPAVLELWVPEKTECWGWYCWWY
ncbi:Endonuclease/Exonuclease/phosphatase family protein [Vibrio aerogenes CECT 7868]|uniref:Endonuclease/Exonuclease/phosphatase family protein n=1 Tax=Vibrio aerogenes CECT 7868 TaxID=1216006 RepID=A0A1M5U4Z5_9VIBR|nr:ExeM/NucH family extracellular endonuclease [Vibrio aerogenes]SHH57950.1 Endonuclease/Exonuclease/phosphatase family protein [Vibrio aerogenes CECT 7868]